MYAFFWVLGFFQFNLIKQKGHLIKFELITPHCIYMAQMEIHLNKYKVILQWHSQWLFVWTKFVQQQYNKQNRNTTQQETIQTKQTYSRVPKKKLFEKKIFYGFM